MRARATAHIQLLVSPINGDDLNLYGPGLGVQPGDREALGGNKKAALWDEVRLRAS